MNDAEKEAEKLLNELQLLKKDIRESDYSEEIKMDQLKRIEVTEHEITYGMLEFNLRLKKLKNKSRPIFFVAIGLLIMQCLFTYHTILLDKPPIEFILKFMTNETMLLLDIFYVIYFYTNFYTRKEIPIQQFAFIYFMTMIIMSILYIILYFMTFEFSFGINALAFSFFVLVFYKLKNYYEKEIKSYS